MDIRGYLSADRVVDLHATTKEGAIMELVSLAAQSPHVESAEKLQSAIIERERIMSTGIGLGIAIPHAKIPSVTDFVVVLGRCRAGIDFQSLDQRPVQIVVLIAGPGEEQKRYLEILAGVTMRLKSDTVRAQILECDGPTELCRVLSEAAG